MIKVVLDARWIPPQLSGIGLYTTELIRALAAEAGEFQIVLLFHRDDMRRRVMEETGADRVEWMSYQLLRWSAEHPVSQLALPGLLRKLNARIYHSPNYLIPLAAFHSGRSGPIRCVATLHDLIPLRFPEYTPRALKTRFRWIFREVLNACVTRMDLVLAPSVATQRDLQDCLGLSPNRIRVTPEASGPQFSPDPACPREPMEILYVGRSDPYKNITGLIEALILLRQEGLPARLRILGEPDPRYPEARNRSAAAGLGDAVRWDGYASGAELVAAYRRAAVFVQPSRMEGFGLPVLEAMGCGTPVACSNRGSLPEVAGDAAL
ncbi:MAG: glycosyltransferase family 1 protein [Kiritimatiellia bacterium]|nr:glycosyltransferase family 1 protein [Kiritimatiellia bacterium]